MYLSYWQFKRKPFTQLFDEQLTVFRDSLAMAFHTVSLAVQLPPAVVWVTGPAGSGKSALLSIVAENFVDECRIISLKAGNITTNQPVLKALEPSLSSPANHLPGGLNQLKSVLVALNENRNTKSTVLCIDDFDADTSKETLRELEAIEQTCCEESIPLTIILTTSDRNSLPPVDFSSEQQICKLETVSESEAAAIIEQRLRAAGNETEIFGPGAKTAIAEYSEGNIRKLLIFADLCLQVGAIKKVEKIDAAFVEKNLAPFIDRVRDDRKKPARKGNNGTEDSRLTETGRFVRLRNNIINARRTLDSFSVSNKKAEKDSAQSDTGSNSNVPAHRLISQIELETYKSTSDREMNRDFVEELQKKIAAGQINLVEAIKQFDQTKEKKDRQGEEKDEATNKKATKTGNKSSAADESTAPNAEQLDSLDAQLLYLRGLEVMATTLETLRLKRFTDLTNVFSLATAIARSVEESTTLLKFELRHQDEYELHHHLLNVGILVSSCARKLGIIDEQNEEYTIAGLLHDIGHLHTNEELIQSPEKFDRKDFRIIKRHPVVGKDMIIHLTNGSKKLAEIISQEHERDDGLGYPNYLVGEQIHQAAKIIGVCDTFEALSHPRSYRKALSAEEALIQISNTLSRRTDPDIVQALYSAVTDSMT